LENLSDSLKKIQEFEDPRKKKKSIQRIVKISIQFSNEIAKSEDYFEAGEFLYSAAEILEEQDFSNGLELYKHNIKLWEKLLDSLKIQAKLHESAEIYLKISDIYAEKLGDIKAQKSNILKSIDYLIQEINLIKDFSIIGKIEARKLTQNFQNIAELYFKLSNFKKAINFYKKVIELAKIYDYYDILSFSYQQIALCYEELDDYDQSKNIILEAVDFFSELYQKFEEKNENLALSQINQILKNLYKLSDDNDQYIYYSKKEAGSYIDLAEGLEKKRENYQKIARYYRGAGLCYLEIENNLIECASCFVLAGNYSEKIEEYDEAAVNYSDAANVFKELNHLQMAYKHFIKAGDDFWKISNLNQSTESYLIAYDLAVEGNFEFDRFGIFNQIVRGLNKIAKEGLKNKQFFIAASLILESIKFYEKLDTAQDILLRDMVNNVYKYYYKAASFNQIGYSHVVHSYILASLCSILNGQMDKALEILSEIESSGKTIDAYKELIELLILWVSTGAPVEVENIPFRLRRIIEGSEEIMFILNLFKHLQPPSKLVL